jgi:RNA recognition motif-containing protein
MLIHVANLTREITEESLRKRFESFGKVVKVTLDIDKITGKPTGFAFVEMSEKAEGDAALAALHKKEFNGQVISLKEVTPESEKHAGEGQSRRAQKGGDPFQRRGTKGAAGYRSGEGVHSGAIRRGGKRGS